MKMNVLDLLKGRKAKVMTDASVVVELEIEKVMELSHSQDLEDGTAENDWWPKSREWKTYDVKFTNGFVKSYSKISELEII